MMKSFAICFLLSLAALPLQAAELALPKLPDASKLSAPEAKALGLRDGGAGLAVGTAVPAFKASAHTGEPVSQKDLLAAGKPLLVIFYRGGWCPYCNLQIRQLTEAYNQFAKRNVELVLISADKVDGAALAQRRYEIPFPVLADPELSAHEAFNVVMTLSPELVETYKGYGIDVEQWSGKTHHKFALASAFIVNPQGKVQWAHVSEDYKSRPSVPQLLGVIDGLK
ncbi:peroxiredoxin family protein [Simiduia sp. 21SJ11W-1]|uniref:peroxiredoxin family protein n=1 Tax=Simiduia sp. 21SJ11W-1 TaxID=2909669 RepID=UPI0020A221F3|nr:peroxiredoxin family protein [Simiduia sp. 21SJ11W-1]UTA48391.1 peroxiredoxin family protein [Simiduia sp. 21SJ11W-1]